MLNETLNELRVAQSSSWEDDSNSASQEIPRLLWHPKFHYCVHRSPTLDAYL